MLKLVRKLIGLVFFSIAAVFIGGALYLSLYPDSDLGDLLTVEDPIVVSGYTDLFIHPQCLEFLAPWDKSNPQIIECADYDLSIVEQSGNNVSASYGDRQSIHYSYPVQSDSVATGRDFRLLEVEIRGGGSGAFSSIVFLERDQASQDKYTVWLRTPSGDRCNDGFKTVSDISPNGFVFKAAATPFRLINPEGITDWRSWRLSEAMMEAAGKELERPPVLNDWLPYDVVTNSANACVGWIVRRYNYDTGFEIVGVELSEQLEVRADEASLDSCINGWLAAQVNVDSSYNLEAWNARLSTLTSACSAE